MKKLQDILEKIPVLEKINDREDIVIRHLSQDSRKVQPGTLFIAVKGTLYDGHQFIDQAIEKGATVVVCERVPSEQKNHVCYIRVADSAYAMGLIAHSFYDYPSDHIKVIGVTGTNGKTTTATLLYQLFSLLGQPSGLISTVKLVIGEKTLPAILTTPDSITLHQLLAEMREQGCKYCFMEVSSIGVHQHRIAGIRYRGGIFTNLTHDHLDYHKTFSDYLRCKQQFFDMLPPDAFALYNKDDKNGGVIVQNTVAKKYSYALKSPADFKCKVLENSITGLVLKMDHQEVYTHLLGRYNAYNLLATYATAAIEGFDQEKVITLLSRLRPADGRFEVLRGPGGIIGVVDYAHTPDALKNILDNLNELKNNGQIITVVGCGGNRDKEKRPLMAKIAATLSDKVVITSDNPRNEDPVLIIEEMMGGLTPVTRKKTICIADRREAIKTAVMLAKRNDIILVAGKGHETYQEIKGVRYPFDDQKVLSEYLYEMK